MTTETFFSQFKLPKYHGGGITLDIYPCGRGDYQLCIQEVKHQDVADYLARLGESGFQCVSEKSIGNNSFRWYESSCYSAYVSFMPNLSTLRIICGKKQCLPQAAAVSEELGAAMSVSQIGILNGMCYCIILKDGSFLIIDGGYTSEEGTQMLYAFLREHTIDGKKPLVRAWFMSHTHPDHTRMAEDFMKIYHDEVDLLAAVYNFPDFERITVVRESAETDHQAAIRFEGIVRQNYPHATHITCRTGQALEFAGVTATTIMTHEDIYPTPIISSNHTSCAWRFDFESGRSFICLGDIWTEMCEQLAKTFTGEYLKADIMQVTHHGLLGGHIDLYRAIDPEICLWPSPPERFWGTWVDPRRTAIGKPTVQYCIGEGGCDYNQWLRDDTVKKRTHFHAGKTITVPV